MATIFRRQDNHRAPAPVRLAPGASDRVLAGAAVLLFLAMTVAILRGRADWTIVPPAIWLHLATIAAALLLTPVMLLRPRGDRRHRLLGWLWSASMIATALLSFGIRASNDGRLSVIHILSAWVLLQVPLIVLSARRHRVAQHRTRVRAMVVGALLVAGFFTFPFDRLLGHWLFG